MAGIVITGPLFFSVADTVDGSPAASYTVTAPGPSVTDCWTVINFTDSVEVFQ